MELWLSAARHAPGFSAAFLGNALTLSGLHRWFMAYEPTGFREYIIPLILNTVLQRQTCFCPRHITGLPIIQSCPYYAPYFRSVFVDTVRTKIKRQGSSNRQSCQTGGVYVQNVKIYRLSLLPFHQKVKVFCCNSFKLYLRKRTARFAFRARRQQRQILLRFFAPWAKST